MRSNFTKINNLTKVYEIYYNEHTICTGIFGKMKTNPENKINSK